jgi:hypothetical protein
VATTLLALYEPELWPDLAAFLQQLDTLTTPQAAAAALQVLHRRLGASGQEDYPNLLSEVRQSCDRVAILALVVVWPPGRWPRCSPTATAPACWCGWPTWKPGGRSCRGRYPGSASRRCPARRPAASTGRHRHRDAGQPGLYLTELRPDEADLEAVLLELTADPPLEVTR